MLMTSMMGDTTRVLSWKTKRDKSRCQSKPRTQLQKKALGSYSDTQLPCAHGDPALPARPALGRHRQVPFCPRDRRSQGADEMHGTIQAPVHSAEGRRTSVCPQGPFLFSQMSNLQPGGCFHSEESKLSCTQTSVICELQETSGMDSGLRGPHSKVRNILS